MHTLLRCLGVFAAAMALVGVPDPALACDRSEPPLVADVVATGPGGELDVDSGPATILSVHEHLVVAWSPALWPLTSQRATLVPRRSWGGQPPDLARPFLPAVQTSQQPYLLFGDSCGARRMPKVGDSALTVVHRDVGTGQIRTSEVAPGADPWASTALSDDERAALAATFGTPEVHPVPLLRAAFAWPWLWWPHLLLLGLLVVLVRRHTRRFGPDRDEPWHARGARRPVDPRLPDGAARS